MASEAGPGEASAPPECSENLRDPAGGLLVGEPLEPPGVQFPESCSVGAAEQVTAVEEPTEEPTQEVAALCVVTLQENEVPNERDVVEMGKDVLAEDITEVEEVVPEEEVREKEPQERQKKTEQAQSGPGPATTRPSLEALDALQLLLEPVNARASRAFSRLKCNMWQRRKSQLARRSAIIQSIPGFWVKAISRLLDPMQILNHPQMSVMINEQDEDMLNYMTNLEVEKVSQPKNNCKITFFFRSNPYFQNEVIIKEYDINITGYRASHSTPIQWLLDDEFQSYSKHHKSMPNFFNWFSDYNFAGSDRIAEIISEDLWLNPMRYYPREEGTRRGNEENRAPAVCDTETIEHQRY